MLRPILLVLIAVAVSAGALAQRTTIQPRRVVYLLAGQSNIERMADPAPSCTAARAHPNVTYYGLVGPRGGAKPLVLTVPIRFVPTLPLMEFGELIARHHRNDRVDVVLIARSGSALLMRNAQAMAPCEAWVDPGFRANPEALIQRMSPALFDVAMKHPDELHIIWGQGETDCFPGQQKPTTADEYAREAQLLFAQIAAMLGVNDYSVHLVTLGAILASFQDSQSANQIRDAFFEMERAPAAFPISTARIATVAHQYDIDHPLWPWGASDVYHLEPCGYVQLAHRIVDGIVTPQLLPRVVDLSMVGTTRIRIRTTTPLVPVATTATLNPSFEVAIDGVVTNAFTVTVAGQAIDIDLSGAVPATATVKVRHVAGSGFGVDWRSVCLATPAGYPLEPFVLSR